MGQVAVIGSGSWGTTLSIIVAQAQGTCSLWMHNYDEAREIAARRENVRFLPGVTLPATVQIEHELEAVLADADVVIVAVPMRRLEENWREIAAGIDSTAIVVSGIKGLMPRSGERVSEVLTRISGPDVLNRFSVLSGPNLAREIVAGEPATSVVAATSSVLATQVQARLRAPTFRTYISGDVVGVELAGALKNVIAIGAGMADGLRFGDNAKAALMTRGLAEIARLGVAAGADPLTFAGLAGMGDLIATCASTHSRNHYVGKALAEGRSLEEIQSHMVMVAEGVDTARGALVVSTRLGVEMPIVELMNEVLFAGMPVAEAGEILMARELSHELRGLRSA